MALDVASDRGRLVMALTDAVRESILHGDATTIRAVVAVLTDLLKDVPGQDSDSTPVENDSLKSAQTPVGLTQAR